MLTFKSILRLATPPYFFQPLQVFKRLRLEYFWRAKKKVVTILPWRLPIAIDPREAIGYDIACHGLYEIGMTEALWRLTEPGDLAIDAGSNIGYAASILAIRVGSRGRILCFEPHPLVFESLKENVEIWRKDKRCGTFVLYETALGVANGRALLHTNDWFQTNRGTAWLSAKIESAPEINVIEVPVRSLDSLLDGVETIGIVKMDVQGSELSVFEGMTQLLERRAVRDIVFEELTPFPAPTHRYLQSKGYSIFELRERFTRIHCLSNTQSSADASISVVPNYLATLKPDRAQARLNRGIWRSFGLGRFLPGT